MLATTFEISKTFAVSKFNEYYLPSINRHTFEQIDSISYYDNKYNSSLSNVDTLHVIIGLDSGLLANYVMDKPIAEGAMYIFVELDPVLELLTIDIPNHLKGVVKICSVKALTEILKEADINLFIVKEQFMVHQSSAVSGGYIDDYAQLNHDVEKAVEHEHFEQQVGFNQKIFIRKQLQNITENVLPASGLRGKFKNKTCIMLGGGPSLDNNLEWVKQNADNLIIFAVSRLAGMLAKKHIHVDVLVSVDPQDHAFEVYREMMPLAAQHLLIASHHLSPLILGQWNGCSLYTSSRYPWSLTLDGNNIPNIGPTVTNSAIQIAVEMGFNQVLLCGVDFCHSPSGITHAQGTFGAELSPDLGKMFEWVETYSGELAETPIQLLHAAQSLQEKVAERPDVTFINLSKNASKVEGVKFRPADEISLTPIEESLKESLKPANMKLSVEEKLQDMRNSLAETQSAEKKFTAIKKLVTTALDLADKLIKEKNNSPKIQTYSNKIEKIENKINKQFLNESMLIKFYGFYEFSKFLSTKHTDDWTQSQVSQMTKTYYQAYFAICCELQQFISSASTRISSRIDELNPNADVSNLIKQWENDNQLGRSVIWKLENDSRLQKLSESDLAKLEQAEVQYQRNLTESQPAPTSKSTLNNLSEAHLKLSIFLKNKHLIGISKMLQYLTPHKNSQEIEVSKLYALTLSYKLMLENHNEKALAAILKVESQHRNETILKQIIHLALMQSNLKLAEDNYAKIVSYSDEYLPHYAHVLKLSGKPQEALNIYLDYLDKYPEDIPVLLKLGIFLAEVGQIEGAKSAFLQALDVDPNNHAAANYLQQVS
ncbi:motility associated factor glycosyltransferase family protein [Shewanella sp. UCD-KL12]|uniref:motility associated factor glycosyltransferase family protein n=1 Tax=Shewanella sp. UCD-KL12 TaxID=1917163 RepID=UPI0009711889|nr:6-hydroxymethylpterin diphosphokinase MptE-like protein [Shewanella sp. UCD-KL12]